MIFFKVRSLTKEIDKLILKDLSRAMPKKYFTYSICKKVSGILDLVFFATFGLYFFTAVYLQHKGLDVPQETTTYYAKWFVLSIIGQIITVSISNTAHNELVSYVEDNWKKSL